MPKPPSDVLWQRKDIMLVAAGSGPCLRELYFRAAEQGKLQQLMLCRTTADDYTMGTAEEKITRVIKGCSCERCTGCRIVFELSGYLDKTGF